MSGYAVVLADPPWSFGAWNAPDKGRTAAAHYQTMSPADLEAMGSWIIDITAGNSALFLWTTCSTIPQAVALMPQWGYEFRTVAFVWLKMLRKPYRLTPANSDGWLHGQLPSVLGGGDLRGPIGAGAGGHPRGQNLHLPRRDGGAVHPGAAQGRPGGA